MLKMLKDSLIKLKRAYVTFCKYAGEATHHQAELYKPKSKTPRKN